MLNRQPIDRRQVHFNIEIPLSPFQQTRNHGIPRSATGDSKAKMRLDTKSEGRMASWKPTAKARGRPNLKKIPPSIHDLGAVKILPDTASEHSKADIRPNTKSEVSSRKPTARSRGRPKLQKIPPSIHDFGEVKILPGTVIENQINEELMTVASNSSLNKNRLSSASSTLNDSPIDEKNEDTRRSLSIMNNVFGPNFLKDQKGPFETRATASSFSRQKDGAEKELNLASKKPDRPISEGPKSTPLQTAFSKKIYNSDFSNLREKSPRRLPAQKSQKSAKNNNGKPGNDREVPAARSNKMIDDNMSDEDELGHTMFVADSEASEVGSDETNDLLQRFQNPHPKSKEPPHIPPSTSKNLPPIASSNLSPRKLSRPGTPSSFPPTSRPTLPLKPLPTPTSRISPSLPQKSPSQSDSDSDSNSKTVTENNLSEADLLLRSFQRKLPSHSLDPIASQLQSELAALPNPIHARSLPHKSRFESMTSPFPSGKSQPRHRQSVKSSSSLPRFEKNQRLHKRKRDQEIELEESDEAKTDEALIFEMDESFGLERKSLKAPTMKAEKQKIDKGVKEKKTAQAQFSATEGTPGTVRRLIKARMSRAEQQKIDEAEWKPRR